MAMNCTTASGGLALILWAAGMGCCAAREEVPTTTGRLTVPAAIQDQADFATQIKPILEKSCVRCHARGQRKGGFSIETRASVLAGGETGPAVVVGKSDQSLLIELITGRDPDRVMPAKGD